MAGGRVQKARPKHTTSSGKRRSRAIFFRSAYQDDAALEHAIAACVAAIGRERAKAWVDRSVAGVVRVGTTRPTDYELGISQADVDAASSSR